MDQVKRSQQKVTTEKVGRIEQNNCKHVLSFALLFMLAWRNLWRHRRRTLITLCSIAFGFALAVISIGIGDGSHNAMIRNAINMGDGHLTVQVKGYSEAPANYKFIAEGRSIEQALESLSQSAVNGSKPPFTDAKSLHIYPRVSLQVLASTAHNSVGVAVEGIQLTSRPHSGSNSALQDPRAKMLSQQLIEGEWLTEVNNRGVVLGDGMARKLKARLGSKVILMAGTQNGDTQAELVRVQGIFSSGLDELDNYLIIANIDFSRRFLIVNELDTHKISQNILEENTIEENKRPVTRYAIFLAKPDQSNQWKAVLQYQIKNMAVKEGTYSEIVVQDWQELMPQLVQFIVLDDAGNYVFLFLILILVLFGIVNTVLMSVLERTREFGLLRALGLGRYQLMLLVSCEALLLSCLAVVLGWCLGGLLHLWFSYYGLDLSGLMAEGTAIMGTYMDPVIRSELSIERIIQLTLGVFITTLLSGLYPAFKATRVLPVEALRG